MAEKWYNSGFFNNLSTGLGLAAVIASLCWGVKGCSEHPPEYYQSINEARKIEQGYVPQRRDLNEDGRPEQFIDVDEVRYFQTIDGKNLEDELRR
jgi:hypothetical protein